MKRVKLVHLAALVMLVVAIGAGCSKKNDYSAPSNTNPVNNNNTGTSLTLGSNSPVAVGDTLRLTASAISGASYTWSGPAGFYSTSQNPTRPGFAVADAGTYACTASTG